MNYKKAFNLEPITPKKAHLHKSPTTSYKPIDTWKPLAKNPSSKEKTNLVRGKYNAISTNYLVSADITKIGAYGAVYIAIDHASRAVIGHAYTSGHFDANTIIQANLQIQRERAFLPPFLIWHTDRESLFTNKEYLQKMKKTNLLTSRGAAEAFQSQVIESFNRTFKAALKKKLAAQTKLLTGQDVSLKGSGLFQARTITPPQAAELVKLVIEEYNNKKHSQLPGLTPNQMEEALFLKHKNQHPQGNIVGTSQAQDLMITRSGDIEDALANAYRAQVAAEYKGDWLRFFLDWKKEQQKQNEKVLQAVDQSKDAIITKLEEKARRAEERERSLDVQYQSLYDKFLEIQKQATYLQEAELQRSLEKLQKQAAKNKKKNAQKQPVRQTVTADEVQLIIGKCIKAKTPYIRARRAVAIMVLYLTGLRVQNLTNLEAEHILQLEKQGHTEVRLIKGGAQRHPIRLAHKGRKLLQTLQKEIGLITQDKTYNQPAFTTKENQTKNINHDVLERELNAILVRASEMLKKHIRTHSFRATLVTDLLTQGVPIQDVKEIVGHQRIESTLRYNRNSLTIKTIDKLIAERYRVNSNQEDYSYRKKKAIFKPKTNLEE